MCKGFLNTIVLRCYKYVKVTPRKHREKPHLLLEDTDSSMHKQMLSLYCFAVQSTNWYNTLTTVVGLGTLELVQNPTVSNNEK